MPLVDDLTAITELETQGDAIIIAQDEIMYLDVLSLEGDIPNDTSDIIARCDRKILLQGRATKFGFYMTKLGSQ
jgi:hypothetical protein